MIRILLSPRWLGALVLAALFAVGAYHLGNWQYSRHEAKADRNARISAHYTAEPQPADRLLTATPMPIEHEWRHVTATGAYAAPTLVARGRTFDGDVGYEVLTPFALTSGGTVLIDRGWIPLGDKGAGSLPRIAPPPSGQVEVTGWLRQGEKSLGKDAVAGQLASINLPDAARAAGVPLLGGYIQAATAPVAGATTEGVVPTPLGKPNRDLGPHQAYAYQWWVAMPLGFVLIFFGLRRELGTEVAEDAESGGEPDRERSKPVKVRIWDEEDA